MNGFDNHMHTDQHKLTMGPAIPVLDRGYINRSVARAHRLRAEYIAEWGQRVARTFASLFHGHSRLLPEADKPRDPVFNATQV